MVVPEGDGGALKGGNIKPKFTVKEIKWVEYEYGGGQFGLLPV